MLKADNDFQDKNSGKIRVSLVEMFKAMINLLFYWRCEDVYHEIVINKKHVLLACFLLIILQTLANLFLFHLTTWRYK